MNGIMIFILKRQIFNGKMDNNKYLIRKKNNQIEYISKLEYIFQQNNAAAYIAK